MKNIFTYKLNEIDKVSDIIISNLDKTNIILFNGEIGSGKTTIIKSILEKMGVNENITSPTFSIVNEYLLKQDNIYHFDLYRVKSVDELNQIGFEDYICSNNLCFIEWPKLALKYFFSCYLLINLKLIDKKTREVELTIKNQ